MASQVSHTPKRSTRRVFLLMASAGAALGPLVPLRAPSRQAKAWLATAEADEVKDALAKAMADEGLTPDAVTLKALTVALIAALGLVDSAQPLFQALKQGIALGYITFTVTGVISAFSLGMVGGTMIGIAVLTIVMIGGRAVNGTGISNAFDPGAPNVPTTFQTQSQVTTSWGQAYTLSQDLTLEVDDGPAADPSGSDPSGPSNSGDPSDPE